MMGIKYLLVTFVVLSEFTFAGLAHANTNQDVLRSHYVTYIADKEVHPLLRRHVVAVDRGIEILADRLGFDLAGKRLTVILAGIDSRKSTSQNFQFGLEIQKKLGVSISDTQQGLRAKGVVEWYFPGSDISQLDPYMFATHFDVDQMGLRTIPRGNGFVHTLHTAAHWMLYQKDVPIEEHHCVMIRDHLDTFIVDTLLSLHKDLANSFLGRFLQSPNYRQKRPSVVCEHVKL